MDENFEGNGCLEKLEKLLYDAVEEAVKARDVDACMDWLKVMREASII